jgi:hypothetical protein
MISYADLVKMFNPAEQSAEKCRKQKKRKKNSHLPCAGIILFRFYGYHLSLSIPPSAGQVSTPGT